MARIHLVRHGQASFGADDYDQLSQIGVQQSQIIGRAMALQAENAHFVSGTLKRHKQTLTGFQQGASVISEPVFDARLNEFDYLGIIKAMRPELDSIKALKKEFSKAENPNLAFQSIYDTAMQRWASGEFDSDYSETRQNFKKRINGALGSIVSDLPKNAEVFVFSSGGPISAIIQDVMSLNEDVTRQIERVLHNASVTTISISSRGTHLIALNQYHHLEAENGELITFR